MKSQHLRLKVRVILILTLGLSACVDNQYDLGHVDTEDISFGNELTLPLGSGVISAGDLLDAEDNKELTVDDRGDYLVRYTGDYTVDVPEGLGLDDSFLPPVALELPASLFPPDAEGRINCPAGTEIEFGDGSCNLELATWQIARLDSVVFDHSGGKSRLRLTLAAKGIRLETGSVDLLFSAVFPDGYDLSPETGQDGSFDGGRYDCTIPLDELSTGGKTIDLLLEKAAPGPDDRIVYTASIRVREESQIVVFSQTPGLSVEGAILKPDYEIIYGRFEDAFTAPQIEIRTEGIDDLFEGDDNVLSFADPHIRLAVSSRIGVPLRASYELESFNRRTNRHESASAHNVPVAAPLTPGQTALTRLWLGSVEQSVASGYSFVACDLNRLIRISPDDMTIRTAVRTAAEEAGRPYFIDKGAEAKIEYTAEIPLAPAADFRARTSQTIDDVFDKDLIDYLFSGGTVEITGRIGNSLPVNFKMNLTVTDRAGASVGIGFEPQDVKGSGDGNAVESEVKFLFDEADMSKMTNARHLRIDLDAFGDDALAGKCLRPDQQIKLLLKVKKTGGITI